MDRKGFFTKILAVVGTILVWMPVVAPLGFSIVRAIRGGGFGIDYLMPAELFPVVVVGGGLLLWAGLRAQMRRRLIGWGLAAGVGLLVGSQVLAVASGLGSGETDPVGLPWELVIALIAGYTLAVIAIGIGGVLLVRDLWSR